ncbi:MAG: hypothetical protein M3174_04990 [Actinomycetota bacterium]|nr:hypothetical protein [Actinomycetota bacterium]
MSYAKDAGARRLEDAIAALRGVRRARVEKNGTGISAVRVLVVPERATADTLDRVLDVIRDETGESLARDSVEILHTGRDASRSAQRRRLSSLATERTPDHFKARVVLELAGDTLEGESESPNEKAFTLRSVARATLHSLRELMPRALALESVHLFNTGTHDLAIVALTHGDQTLVGSAVVRVDEHDAVARATLDAVNRSVTASQTVF